MNNELIVKTGLVDKRKVGCELCWLGSIHSLLSPHSCFSKGLFAKRRELILTDAPRLYYVDPVAMVLKGEIPWYE